MLLIKSHARSRGFTLIEMLVVISIIGVMASVILASIVNARDKGVIAGAIQFATTNYHAFGADALAMYNFSEPGGVGSNPSSLTDSSGNNITLTTCTSLSLNSDTPASSAVNTSGSFDPNGNCTGPFPTGIPLPIFTLTAWIKPSTLTAGGKPDLIELNNSGVGEKLYLDNSSGLIKCVTNSFSGIPVSSVTVVKTGKWYHAACSLDAAVNGNLVLYVNGVKEGSRSGVSAMTTWPVDSTTWIYLWKATSAGLLDDATIYTHPLATRDIERLFAQGAAKHGLAVK